MMDRNAVAYPYWDPEVPVGERVKDLLSRMTLLEKVRQMDMYNGSHFTDKMDPVTHKCSKDSRVRWDKLKEIIGEEGIGCIHDLYPLDSSVPNEIQRYCREHTRLGIPVLISEEALHGLSSPGNTIFPQMIALASTFNRKLAEKVGKAIASEIRSKGIHLSFAPVLEISRDPRWGRTEETFGEDTYLAGEMGLNIVRGMQGESLASDTSIVAEPKHFAVHSKSDGGLNCGPVSIGEREIRRDYLPVFRKAIVEGGALSVMCAYHSIDGIPCASSEWLLKDVLRKEWDFKGFVCSDLGAIQRLHTVHKTADTHTDAIWQAISSGVDMQFYDYPNADFQHKLIQMVQAGELDEAEIDRAAGSVLYVKFMLGLFENPFVDTELAGKLTRCQEHLDIALQVARECICLLKNDGILPLDTQKVRKIALIGPNAMDTKLGDYSAETFGNHIATVYEELSALLPPSVTLVAEKGVEVIEGQMEAIRSNALFSPDLGAKGLKGEYYNDMEMRGEPDLIRIDEQIDFNFIMKVPGGAINGNEFAVRWTGNIILRQDKECLVGISSMDRARLWINEELISECGDEMSAASGSRMYRFRAGEAYRVKIEYFKKKGGGEIIRLGWASNYQQIDRAVKIASESDVAILVCGESGDVCGESRDRRELSLPGRQLELLKAVCSTGKPVVLVLMNGRPLTLTWENENTAAIVESWYPGEFGAKAIAQTLLGQCCPSGKLPISFPRSVGQLPVYYNRPEIRGKGYVDGDAKPLFSFGDGLSYASFRYSDLVIQAEDYTENREVSVQVCVENISDVEGMETVQLYVIDEYSSTVKGAADLKCFEKITLKPHQSKIIRFKLGDEALSTLGKDMVWRVEPGWFRILVGGNLNDCLQGRFKI